MDNLKEIEMRIWSQFQFFVPELFEKPSSRDENLEKKKVVGIWRVLNVSWIFICFEASTSYPSPRKPIIHILMKKYKIDKVITIFIKIYILSLFVNLFQFLWVVNGFKCETYFPESKTKAYCCHFRI